MKNGHILVRACLLNTHRRRYTIALTNRTLGCVMAALVALEVVATSMAVAMASQPPIAAPDITAERAIVFDPTNGSAVYEKQADSKALTLPPSYIFSIALQVSTKSPTVGSGQCTRKRSR